MSALISSPGPEISDASLSSSDNQKPLIHNERNRLLVALVIITSLLLIWGVSLLPTIFYVNKLEPPKSKPGEQQVGLNMR